MKRSYEGPILTKQKPLEDVTAQPYYYISPVYGAPPGNGGGGDNGDGNGEDNGDGNGEDNGDGNGEDNSDAS